MKELKRGERVKFLNDVGVGTVTRLIDKDMVMVRTEDGFEYPVLRSELIGSLSEEIEPVKEAEAIENSVKPSVEQVKSGIENSQKQEVSGPVNVYLALVPLDNNEPVTGDAELFLINDSNYMLLYHCSIAAGGFNTTLASGTLEPDTKLLIANLHLDDMFGKGKGIGVSVIPFANGRHPRREPLSQIVAPGREFLSGRSAYLENDYTDEDAYIVHISGKPGDDNSSPDLARLLHESLSRGETGSKDRIESAAPQLKKVKPSIEEVDLHIGEIVESTAGLMAGEILRIQLDRFRTSLDGAILSRQNRIVFIHGAGEGKLKLEIRKIIDQDYPRCRYQDASFKEYGYGATMVLIR